MDELYRGLRVIIDKINCGDGTYAGKYEIQAIDHLSPKLRLVLSGGEPFKCAFTDAERLAVLVDAEFVLKEGFKEIILRKSQTGEYYHREKEQPSAEGKPTIVKLGESNDSNPN